MQAEITYTKDTGEKLVNETFGPNNIRRRTSGAEERHRVEISNGREARDLALDANGFILVEHRTAMRDFFDAKELKQVYYPEVEALIKRVAADRTVLMVEHNLSVVAKLSDRITVLSRGEIIAEGDYGAVSKHPDVIQAYLGSEHA